jgi:Zinc-finger associated domain (zf-AD)
VCLSKDNATVVPIQAVSEERSVADMIHYISGVKVAVTDNLPKFVCSPCLKNLLTSCRTKDQCIESNRNLRWKWVDNDIVADPQHDEDSMEMEMTGTEPQTDVFETDLTSDVCSEMTLDQIEMLDDEEPDKAVTDDFQENLEFTTEELEFEFDDGCKEQIESIITTDDEDPVEETVETLEMIEKVDDCDPHQIYREHNYLEADPDEIIEYITEDEPTIPFELESPTNVSQKTYKCYICAGNFESEQDRDEHLSTSHRNEVLLCYICLHECRNSQALDEHLKKHDGTMLYAPSMVIPSDKFTVQYLQDETVEVKKSSHYVCKIIRKCYLCGEKFKNRNEKREHLRVILTVFFIFKKFEKKNR